MKNILGIILFFCLTISSFGDVKYKESFEAAENPGVTYTSDVDFYTGVSDYWWRTNSSFTAYPIMPTNFDGSFAYFGEDIQQMSPPPGPTNGYATITLVPINSSGWTGLTATILIQTGGTDYESLDRVTLFAGLDGGDPLTNQIGNVYGATPNDNSIYIDGNTNNLGTTTNFTKFSFPISGTPTQVVLVVQVMNSVSAEALAIDAVALEGTPPEPLPWIRTIKPGGGGDFTTLQAWENWADDQTNAAQWAECYEGGDLGEVTISGWAATPTATHYPKIYAAAGNRHSGSNTADGAYMDVGSGNIGIWIQEPFVQVDGIRMEITNASSSTFALKAEFDEDYTPDRLAENILVENCLVRQLESGVVYGDGMWFYWEDTGNQPTGMLWTVRNNILYGGNGTYQDGIKLEVEDEGTGSITINAAIYNNTSFDTTRPFVYDVNKYVTIAGWLTFNVYDTNNVGMAAAGGSTDFDTSVGARCTLNNYRGYAVSSDNSADDEGGTGNQTNITPVAAFTDPTNNVVPVVAGPLQDNGVTVSGFTNDAVGTTRPVGPAWDIGAIEQTTLAPVAPTVNNGTGASSIGSLVADLAGNVTTGGTVDAWIYYGTTDQTNNKTGWDTNIFVGSIGQGAFTNNVTGLTQSQTYYYRCYATNVSGEGWANSTTNFTTLPYVPKQLNIISGGKIIVIESPQTP